MEDINNVQAAAALGVAANALQEVGNTPFVVAPTGYEVKPLESMLLSPTRKKGSIAYRDAVSFCIAVNAQKGDSTRLYSNPGATSFACVFNDHGTVPGWRDHIATYACPKSVEWATWTASNKKVMGQEAFAQFIEDNAPDCVSPDAATMIEISRTLQAKKGVNFASGIRLDNGQVQFKYEETIAGTAGSKGQLSIPETFSIGIAALEGGPKYAVQARLRYRIDGSGVLTMWFDLERPHKVIEDAAKEVLSYIAEKTSLPILNGG